MHVGGERTWLLQGHTTHLRVWPAGMRAHVLAACLVGAVLCASATGQPTGEDDELHVTPVGERDESFVWRPHASDVTETRGDDEGARWRRAPPSPPGPGSGSGTCAQGAPCVLSRSSHQAHTLCDG